MRFISQFILLLLLSAPALADVVSDDAGAAVEFDAPFTRIISLYGAHTENLFALGLDEEIVGVSASEDFPSRALQKPQFSVRDGAKKILESNPDLILIQPNQIQPHRALWRALERAGVRVMAFQPGNVDEMFAYWRKLGLLTGREPQAEDMTARFNEGIERARQRTERIPAKERPDVFFESVHRKFATFAPDSIPMFVLETAGGRNIAPDARTRIGTDVAELGLERLLSRAEAIDVYLAQHGPMNEIDVRKIKRGPAASRIKAVTESAVFLVDERIVSRPTMRLLLGVDTVFRLLHPDFQ